MSKNLTIVTIFCAAITGIEGMENGMNRFLCDTPNDENFDNIH